jgi:hypothetical protein
VLTTGNDDVLRAIVTSLMTADELDMLTGPLSQFRESFCRVFVAYDRTMLDNLIGDHVDLSGLALFSNLGVMANGIRRALPFGVRLSAKLEQERINKRFSVPRRYWKITSLQ